ncbi:MAG: DNA (cytosine-5-)-methyltransferase [Spirochaetia bacterium]|nr:DNA (cytosine-5-)-methyltransferase [Spirochaetia bacterium]
MKHIELFSGIGGFRQALNLIQKDFNIQFDCAGFSEIDKNASLTYKCNYDTSNEVEMGDIVSFNEDENNIRNLHFDLLTGGFPCQPFSMMGEQRGFDDTRGTMFFEIEKILRVKMEQGEQIPFVVLENVKNLYTHNNGNTFNTIKNHLENLGYHFFSDIFDTENFALAQKRNRIIMFATNQPIPDGFIFSAENIKRVFDEHINEMNSIYKQKTTLDVLEKEVPAKYYLSEKIKPTILSNGTAGFRSNSKINLLTARPLCATMHKMHRACQDNYYSQEFITSENPEEYLKTEYSKEEEAKHKIRKLTPEEAFNLQGFPKEFCKKPHELKMSDGALYKQAGNAVSVNVIYAIMYYIFVNQGFGV